MTRFYYKALKLLHEDQELLDLLGETLPERLKVYKETKKALSFCYDPWNNFKPDFGVSYRDFYNEVKNSIITGERQRKYFSALSKGINQLKVS